MNSSRTCVVSAKIGTIRTAADTKNAAFPEKKRGVIQFDSPN